MIKTLIVLAISYVIVPTCDMIVLRGRLEYKYPGIKCPFILEKCFDPNVLAMVISWLSLVLSFSVGSPVSHTKLFTFLRIVLRIHHNKGIAPFRFSYYYIFFIYKLSFHTLYFTFQRFFITK